MVARYVRSVLRKAGCLTALLMVVVAAPAQAVQLVKVGSFSAPTYVTAPAGDAQRLFVTQQGGKIEVMVGGVKQSTPFLDLTSKVKPPGGTEQGLLSMAFAPDYATSGRFYVYYTSRNCPSSPGCDEHVSEFHRSAANPNVADPASEHVLLTIPHPSQTNHNGGQLQFGPDGYLYISTGDGGGGNDTQQNSQKKNVLLGKILRINPTGGSPYSIPAGNPFGGSLCTHGSNGGAATCPEIWAYGLRNAWRFSFDAVTGDLVIGDVGQSAEEEIDFAHPGQNVGANYGWPCYEGNRVNSSAPSGECATRPSPVVAPVFQYPHACSGTAACGAGIVGGFVVRDPSLGPLVGRYIYGDVAKSALRSLVLGQPAASGDGALGLSVSSLSSFGQDAGRCVYAASVGSGSVFRITPDTNPTPGPCPLIGQPPAPGPQLTVSARKRQHIVRVRQLKLTVTASEASTIIGTARVTVSRRHNHVLHFRGVTHKAAAAGRKAVLRLRLTRRNLSLLRTLIHRRHSMVAKLTVVGHNAAGGNTTVVRAVRLIR
jgi:glucose/arabinose dehydrogenase